MVVMVYRLAKHYKVDCDCNGFASQPSWCMVRIGDLILFAIVKKRLLDKEKNADKTTVTLPGIGLASKAS